MKNKKRIFITSGLVTLGVLLFIGGFSGISSAIKENFNRHKGDQEIVDGSYVDGKIMVKLRVSDADQLKAAKKLAKGRESLIRNPIISNIERTVYEQQDDDGEFIWYECSLDNGANIKDAVRKMDNVPYVACAEPLYVRNIDSTVEGADTEGVEEQCLIDFGKGLYPMASDDINLAKAQQFLVDNGINKGGSNDVIVAVLDTGVDYTHPALRNNMWINTAEIPGNGMDDDNNGYVDDVYGASVLGSTYNHTGDPMDVNGHGTHVAGIIAARKVNNKGVVGVANNVRIMAIRAGQPSGVFTTADIVDGITYAYKMGADVLNMSFGGYTRSQLEIDALQRAYNTTVLCAAAGNDTMTNLPYAYGRDMYPGALPWVVGVMSSDSAATPLTPSYLSYFSNVDYYAADNHEYEVCAPGYQITSTLPNNRYATWSGTSMATPVVAGIAALLRSYFTDKVEYTSRFIMGQLSSTGNDVVYPTPYHATLNSVFNRIDAYKALTERPQPKLELYDFFIDDSPSIDARNDGDGALDSGETVHLGVSIKNLWGKATNVSVKLDSISNGGVADPYITYERDTVNYLDVGAWEEMDNGWNRDSDSAILGIDPDQAFIIHVDEHTPNDIVHSFYVTITCTNGMDSDDQNTYIFAPRQGAGISYTPENYFTITSRNGRELPQVISEDMTLTKDFYWIMPSTTRIEDGVTVTVEAGTQIQFYSSEDVSVYAEQEIVNLIVRGKFITLGTPEEPVELFPSPLQQAYTVNIDGQNGVFLNYTNIMNPCVTANQINSCYFYQDEEVTYNYYLDTSTANIYSSYQGVFVNARDIKDTIFYNLGMLKYPYWQFNINANTIDCCLFNQCYMTVDYGSIGDMTNCVFLNNSNMNEYGEVMSSSIQNVNYNEDATIQKVVERDATGTVYIMFNTSSYAAAKRFANYIGGYIVSINDQEEYNYLNANFSDNYYIGYTYDAVSNKSYWEDGTAVTFDLLGATADKSSISGNRRVMAGSGYSTWEINDYWYSDGKRFVIEVPQQNVIKKITFADQSIEIDDETVGYVPRIDVLPVTADKADLVYASMDENVFTVDANGAITATGKGNAELVVSSSDGYVTKSIMVNVVDKVAVENVQADIEDLFIEVNDSYQLNIEYTPTNTTEKAVTYESSDPTVVAVNEAGVITALDVGSADIMIYDAHGVLRQTIHVQSEILVDELMNSEDIYYSYVGQTIQLDVTYSPSTATLFRYTYESSNPDVASVDSNGKITVLKEGYALIRVKDRYSGVYLDVNVTATGTYIEEPNMKDIVFSNNYYYALSDEGYVYYWGNGVNKTTKLMSLANVTNIFGYYTSEKALALTSDGALYVLSSGSGGVNVNKVNTSEVVVRAFTFSNKYYFEVENGDIYAFGENNYGSLGTGNNSTVSYSNPAKVFSYGNVRSIGGNYRISVIVTNDNETYYSGREDDVNVFTDFTCNVSLKEIYSCDYWDQFYALSVDGSIYTINVNSFDAGNSWSLNEFFNRNDDIAFDDFRSFYIQNSDYYAFVLPNGSVKYNGYNEYGKFGSYMNNSWLYAYESYNVYEGFKANKVVFNSYNSAIVTEEGRIYMMGYSANGRMGFNGTGNVRSPKQVYFDVQVPGSLEVSSSNLSLTEMNSNVDPKQIINVKFNQGVVKGTGYNNIKIVDRNGNRPEFTTELTINGINIVPVGSWNSNTSYTLTIPSAAVANNFGDTSSQCIIRFTSGSVLVDSLTFNDSITIDSETTNYVPDFTVSPLNADLSTLRWSSTDENVFVVDESGKITATGVGSAQLVVVSSDGYLRRVNTVSVYEHIGIEDFSIGKDNYELIYGDSALIETTIIPSNATEPLSFVSSDNSVVTVSPSGLIETVGTGDATITVSNNRGTVSKIITVRVDRDIESISADSVVYGLVGQTKQLNIEIVPENATRVNLVYQSDNEEYVTVDENGLVSFLQAGLSTIRVTETNSKTVLDIMVSVSASEVDEVKVEKVAIAGSYYYALDTKGNVYRWGNGISLPNLVETNVKDIAGSGFNYNLLAMLYKDNSVKFFNYDELRSTMLTDIASIYAFGGKIYALGSDDTLYAYGSSEYYSLGTGSNGHQGEFVDIGTFANVKTIAGGYYCTFILLENGTVYAAGGHQVQYETFTKLKLNIEVEDIIESSYDYDGTLVMSKTGKLYVFDTGSLYLGSVYEGYYNTVNAKQIATSNSDGKAILYNDGTVQFFGYNDNRRFGNTSDSWLYDSNNVKPEIDNVKFVEISQYNTFFVKESGELYMMGSGANSRLGVNNIKFAEEPVKINFTLESEKELAVVSTSLDSGTNNIAKDQPITITFNQKVLNSNNWNNIRVETRTGIIASTKRTLGFNSITITPTRGWEQGATYNVIIPGGAVKTNLNQQNESLVYNFTTGNSIINSIYFDSSVLAIDTNTADFYCGLHIEPSEGKPTDLIWESSDESVFTVDNAGNIHVVGVGSAELYVRTGDNFTSASRTVNVTEYVALEQLIVGKTNYEISIYDNFQIEYSKLPSNATPLITFESSDEDVVRVNTNGYVTPVGTGNATITVRCADQVKIITLKVDAYAETIIARDVIYGKVGDVIDLDVELYPENVTIQNLTYEVDNTSNATVDNNGLVTLLLESVITVRVTETNKSLSKDIVIVCSSDSEDVVVEKIIFVNNDCRVFLDNNHNLWMWSSSNPIPSIVLTDVLDAVYYWNSFNEVGWRIMALGTDHVARDYNVNSYSLSLFQDNVFTDVASVNASFGGYDVLIVRNNGDIYTKGNNGYGILGSGEESTVWDYTRVDNKQNIKKIVMTYYLTVIQTEDEGFFIAGGTSTRYTTFTPISYSVEIKDIFRSGDEIYAVSNLNNVYQLNTADGSLVAANSNYYSNELEIKSMSEYNNRSYAYVLEDGTVRLMGQNDNTRLGGSFGCYYSGDANINTADGLDNVKDVYMYDNGTLFLKNDGSIYFIGYVSGGLFGPYEDGGLVYSPRKVEMNYPSINDVEIVSSSLDQGSTNIDPNLELQFVFNQKVTASSYYNLINVKTRNGTVISNINKSFKFNTLTISNSAGWDQNEVYILTIRADSFRNSLSKPNEEIVYTFTAGPKPVMEMSFSSQTLNIDTNTIDFDSGFTYGPIDADLSTIEFTSSDENVFTVNELGQVTGLAAGTGTLTVKSLDNALSASITVNVSQYVALENFVIGKNNYQMQYGNTALIETTKMPSDATLPISFTSSNEEVITVSTDGLMTAVGTGSAVITVKCGEFTYEINVSSDAYIDSLNVETLIEGRAGENKQLDVIVAPDYATICDLTYVSDNEQVVTVSDSGLISFVSEGTATIRVKEINSKLYQDIIVSVIAANDNKTNIKKVIPFGDVLTLAIDDEGNVYAWGKYIAVPRIAITGVRDICMYQGTEFVVLFENGTAEIWCYYTGEDRIIKNQSATLSNVTNIYGGRGVAYALDENDVLYAFGYNYYGKFGNGSQSDNWYTNSFNLVAELDNLKNLVVAEYATVILLNDGTVLIAGTNEYRYDTFTELNVNFDVNNIYPSIGCDEYGILLESTAHKLYCLDSYSGRITALSSDYYASNYDKFMSIYVNFNAMILDDGSILLAGVNNYRQMDTNKDWVPSSDNYIVRGEYPFVSVAGYYSSLFAIDSNGDLYGFGYKRFNNQFGFAGNENCIYTPCKINFDLVSNSDVSIVSSTLDNGNTNIALDQKLSFVFNQKVDATLLSSIRVKDRLGNSVSVKRALDFNTLTINPTNGWGENKVYIIEIPANVVKNVFGFGNQAISFTFATGNTPVENMQFAQSEITIGDNISSYDCGLAFEPTNADASTIVFESSDESVFTVDTNGLISAVGVGSAVLTARTTDGYIEITEVINVTQYVALEGFTIAKDNFQMQYGNTAVIESTKTPTNATANIVYISSDETVATVSAAGVITAVGTGDAVITVSCDSFSYEINVRSDSYVEELLVESELLEGNVGSNIQINIDVNPVYATICTLTFESDNSEIASVDANGLVTINRPGFATIRVRELNSGLYKDIAINSRDTGSSDVRIVKALSTSSNKSFALDDEGNLYLWTSNNTNPYIYRTNVKDICRQSYNYYAVLYNDGRIEILYQDSSTVWSEGYKNVENIDKIYCYHDSLFAVDNEGYIYAMGSNNYGKLGTSTNLNQSLYNFELVAQFDNIKTIAGTDNFNIILLDNGEVYCAGTRQNSRTTFTKIDLPFDVLNAYVIFDNSNYMYFESTSHKFYRCYSYEFTFGYVVEDAFVPENYVDFVPLSANGYAFIQENGRVLFTGENIFRFESQHNYPYVSDNAYIDFDSDVVSIYQFNGCAYIVTANGKLYALGTRSFNGQFGLFFDGGFSSQPIEIPIGLNRNNEISIKSCSFDNGTNNISTDAKLEFVFNQKVDVGMINLIKVTTRTGTNVSIKRTFDFNKLIISNPSGWEDGVVYNLNIPQGLFKNVFGDSNEEITYKFTTGNQPVENMYFASESISINTSVENYDTGLSITPVNADRADLVFVSSDEEVFVVDENGLITATGLGTATLTVRTRDGYLEANQEIIVKQYVAIEDIVIEQTVYNIEVGDTVAIAKVVAPTNATETIIMESSNSSVVSVTNSGIMTANRKGSATITIRSASGDVVKTIEVVVKQFVQEIASNNDVIIVEYEEGGYYQLQYEILPEGADAELEFISTDDQIAATNRNGRVFYNDKGLVTIRVRDKISGCYHDFTLSIMEEVSDVRLIQVAANAYDNVYLLDDVGQVWYIGNNYTSPQKTNLENITKISAGNNMAIALSSDGKIFSMNGLTGTCFTELSGAVDIYSTWESCFAVLSDNSLWGYGSNDNYKLGLGDTNSRNRPAYIGTFANIKDIVSSQYGTLMLLKNGDMYVTGYLGNTTFQKVSGFTNVEKIAGVYNWIFFICNGRLYQIGNGDGEIVEYNGYSFYTYKNLSEYDYVISAYGNRPTGLFKLNDYEIAGAGYDISYKIGRNSSTTSWWSDLQLQSFATFDEKVVSYALSENNSFFVTESGKLYGTGSSNYLGYGVDAPQQTPHRIRFDLATRNLASNAGDLTNIALNQNIEIKFNQKVLATNVQNISVVDAEGNYVATINSVDLDKIIIKPYRPWNENATYTVRVQWATVRSMSGEYNNDITFNFTTATSGSQPGEGNQGQWFAGSGNNSKRVVADKTYVEGLYEDYVAEGLNSKFTYNAFMNDFSITDVGKWMRVVAGSSSEYSDKEIALGSNYWGTTNTNLVEKQIIDYDDYPQYYNINPYPILTEGLASMYPFVSKVEIIDGDGQPLEYAIQGEENHIRLYFNRDMDTTIDLGVFYGPDMPYTDWRIDGHYVDTRTWEGDFTLSTLAGNGLMHLFIVDGAAADNNWLRLHKDQHFTFSIRKSDTAESLNLVATGAEGRVILNWEQDDFETLAGYNVYRANSPTEFSDDQSWKDSHRINNSIINEKTYEDTNVEPGQIYYYRFTVVQTDLVESEYSNTAPAAAMDTTPPVINHEVISSGTTNCDLYINATVTDNVEVTKVTLYYSINDGEYKSIEMIDTGENNNVYSAMVPGKEMVSGSIKYYIVAFDGISNAYHGDANQPHYARIGSKPVINSVSPNTGDIRGGEEVIVSGMNFRQGDKIKFGSTFAQNIQVIDSNTIKCNAPMVSIPQTVNVMVVSDDGGYYTLINGYTYTSGTVYAEIPDVRGTYGSYIEVPINLSNAKGLVSADIVIGYRSADLEYVEANKGTLGRSFSLVDDGGNGEVAISAAGATSITGNGSIVNLKFKVKIQEGETTQLSFRSISLNGGSIEVETSVGQVIGVKAYSVTGNITYYASGLGVENVNVYLSGKDSISTTSNGSGEYAFYNLDVGSYDLNFSKNDDINGITALDASYILQYKVGIRSLTSNQLIAADANNNGVVDSFDASLILQYSVGLIELPFSGRNETWVFKNNNQSLGELSANYEAGNNQAILIGDVTGDWSNQSQGNALNNNPFGAIQVGKVNIINNQVIVPVMVKNGGADVYSVQFALRYSNDLTYVGYQLDNDAMVAVNSNVPGAIRVATASATDILDDELVYYFTFNIKNAADSYFFSVNDSNINEHYNIVNYANAVVTSDTITVTAEEILAHYNKTYLDGDISRYDLDGNGVVDMFDVITLQNRAQ